MGEASRGGTLPPEGRTFHPKAANRRILGREGSGIFLGRHSVLRGAPFGPKGEGGGRPFAPPPGSVSVLYPRLRPPLVITSPGSFLPKKKCVMTFMIKLRKINLAFLYFMENDTELRKQLKKLAKESSGKSRQKLTRE